MSNWIVAVFLGDSLTAGFQQGPGYMPPRYYPFTNLLESSIRLIITNFKEDRDFVIVNQGIDGDSTSGMLERFSRCVEPEHPEIVIIWGGINDLSSRKSPEEIFTNIDKLVKRTRSINAVPIVINVAPVVGSSFNETIIRLNFLTQDYCRKNRVEYIDVFSELIDSEGKLADEFSNDGIHLSDSGYRKVIQPIYESLIKMVKEMI
jgi:lysophospholipase L1-like esterase